MRRTLACCTLLAATAFWAGCSSSSNVNNSNTSNANTNSSTAPSSTTANPAMGNAGPTVGGAAPRQAKPSASPTVGIKPPTKN
jgi:hypothetical protein